MKYEIVGTPFPAVECTLNNGETMNCERGAMGWMRGNFEMKTHVGGFSKMFGRMFSGESVFVNSYTSHSEGGIIGFVSSFPGDILPFVIEPGKSMIVQKSGFLAAEKSVSLSIFFRKRLGSGLFGGEGFIMQKLESDIPSTAFIEIDGRCKTFDLSANEKIVVDTGYLAAMDSTCKMDVEMIKGFGNMLVGGEGMFNTVITGPGKVYVQTHPIYQIASSIRPYLTSE